MDVFTAMKKRRMHRAFSSEPLARDLLDRLVWAAHRGMLARAGVRQLIVVDDPLLMRTFRKACPGFLNDAPAAIAICTDLEVAERIGGRSGIEEIGRIDAGAAAAHLTLAAPALGLGCCIVTSWTASAVRAVLDLPETIRPEILVAVGRVAETPSPGAKAAPLVAWHNRLGQPYEVAP